MGDNRTPNKMPFTKSLFLGLYGEDVKIMKEWLNDLNGYYNFSRKGEIEETNYFGFDAVNFIREFQSFFGLPTTGAYDARTHDMVEWKFFNMADNERIRQNLKILKANSPARPGARRF